MTRVTRVGIVGGGISGLSTAYYLKKQGRQLRQSVEVDLIEREERLGGVIRSERDGDFLLEWGPEGFVSYKPAAIRLVRELGLGEELLGSNDYQRKNYLVLDGELLAYPDGMAFLSPVKLSAFWKTAPLSLRGKLRAFFEPLVSRSSGDLSVSEFFGRRLGREFTQRVVEPMVGAIYGANVNELSALSALPEMYRIEQQYGSLWRGLRNRSMNGSQSGVSAFLTFRNGMGRLVDGLREALEGVNVHTGVKEARVSREGEQLKLEAPGFRSAYDHLVMTIPAPSASSLLRDVHEKLAEELASIPYSSSSLVYLAYRKSEFSNPLDGFGFIVSAEEATVLDACSWVHRKFDGRCPEDSVLLRCVVHDGRRDRHFSSDEELGQRVRQEICRLLNVSCDPVLIRVHHVGRALPQLLVGHSARLARIRSYVEDCPGLSLSGAFYGGVGIPECIATGEATANQILSRL